LRVPQEEEKEAEGEENERREEPKESSTNLGGKQGH
jgi:hypothetical protein